MPIERLSIGMVPTGNWQLAIDSDLAVAEGFEPSIVGLTIRCLTNLATPQENWLRRRESNSYHLVYKTSALNPIELRRKNLVDWEGFKPSQEVCRTSMLSLHHQPGVSFEFRVPGFEFDDEESILLLNSKPETPNSKLVFGGCGWS